MSIAPKDLSLNRRLDKLENELRVMLLFSSKVNKTDCPEENISCDCFVAEEAENSQTCRCHIKDTESPKLLEAKIKVNGFRSKSAPERRTKRRSSSNSPDGDEEQKDLDKILQLFKRTTQAKKKKNKHCLCESSTSDCWKGNKEDIEKLKPIDLRTPPRKSRTTHRHREKVKRLRSSSQTDTASLEITNESVHKELCSCPSRTVYFCDASDGTINYKYPKRTADLELEVNMLRKEIDAISKSKIEADMLKEKYSELQCVKVQFEQELQQLRKENQQLAENLRSEKNVCASKIEEARSEAKVMVEKIHSEEDKLAKDLESKNDLIKMLTKATDDLTKTIHEKEKENCFMCCKIKEIETTTKLATRKISLLKDTNRQLARSVVDKHHSLQNCQSKTCKFKREVKAYKAKVEKSIQEIKRLQGKTRLCECSNKRSPRTQVFCQELSQDTNTVRELVNKISCLESTQLENIAKMAKKNEVLKSGFDDLYQLMTCGDNAVKITCSKCQELKQKYQELREKSIELKDEVKCLKCKEKQRNDDRKELKLIIEELTLLVKKQKERLQEFHELNEKQAQMLVTQEAVIASHNEQVTLIEMENQIIKKKCNELEIEGNDRKEMTFSPLKAQLEEFRLTLAEDRDSLKIKEKIIEDQASTIIDLRKKVQINSEATKNAMSQGLFQQQELKKAQLESDDKIRILECENCVMKENLQQMRNSKTKLQAQIAAIDTHLVRDYRVQADQIEHLNQIVTDLRHQMTLLTEEHEQQMDVLMKDLDSAKMTARFATQKLEETLRDFQRQTNSQMKVRDILTGFLKEKDSKLKNAIVKMSSLTFDPTSVASAISRQKPPDHMQELSKFLNTSNVDSVETTTKAVTTQVLEEEPSSSDFQQQLRYLVPSELYTSQQKKTKSLKEKGCLSPEECHRSGTSGSSSSGTGTSSANGRSTSEKVRKEGGKNIYISPYNENGEPTYIYVPKFRPTSIVPLFEPPQLFESERSNEVVLRNANSIQTNTSKRYCRTNTSQNRTVCEPDTCKNKENVPNGKCKCARKGNYCTCDA